MSESKSLLGDYPARIQAFDQVFKISYCSDLQLVLRKILILSAASIFVTEGLFIYIYFLLFEKIIKIVFSELEKKVLQRFRSFSL